VKRTPIAFLIFFFCANCSPRPIFDRHWPDAYWRYGDYVLLAVDTEAQMSLCADVKSGDKKFAVGIINAAVYSVGANDRYIVAKQHPLIGDSQEKFDRSITNYYIIDRAIVPTVSESESRKSVTGPLTREQFELIASTKSLPQFTKTFHKLEWQRTD
jgi:hypothetical protein